MLKRISAVVGLLLALCSTGAWAEPVRSYQRVPTDIRRTTLIVRDMERSLAFYRDGLSLKVVYDEILTRPAPASNPAAGETAVRLALLRGNDTFIGLIGLLEYQNPRLPEPEGGPQRPGIGDVLLVFNAKDLERRFERVRSTPGVTVASEPALLQYPGGEGNEPIPVLVSSMWDPDGYFVELSQILGTPPGTEADLSDPDGGEAHDTVAD
jgi:catechol 2,3-dioxygenase-like lactoylglutathione lyase family enzyme